MANRFFSSLVFSALFATAVCAQDQSKDVKPLDIEIPFRKAATKRMGIETVIDNQGGCTVLVSLKNIRLRPSAYRSAQAGTESTGTWYGVFFVVPKLSPADNASLLEKADQLFEDRKKMLEQDGEAVRTPKGESQVYSDFSHVVSERYAYRIRLPINVPVHEADRQEVESFVKALASHLKTIDGKDSAELIRSRILPLDFEEIIKTRVRSPDIPE